MKMHSKKTIRTAETSGRTIRTIACMAIAITGLVVTTISCGHPDSAAVGTTSAAQLPGWTSTSRPGAQEEQEPTRQELSEEEMDSSQWPVFRGDTLGTGFTKSSLPAQLNVIWQHKVDNGAFESTAAIVNDVVYIGDLDNKLFALDLHTGKVQWEFETEIGFLAAPAVQNNRIFIGNMDGIFYCLDTDGQELWKHEARAPIDGGASFYKDCVIYGAEDATLYCLKQDTGELVWKHQIDDQIRCCPTVVENRAFVAGCDGVLHIIDLDKGKPVAGVVIDSPTGIMPAVLGDIAYFGTEQAGFFAVDWKQAEVSWHFDDPMGTTPTRSNPAVTSGHVVFGQQNRKVYSLDPSNGDINWSFEARGNVDSSPVIADSRVYVGSDDRRMYVLNLADGKLLSERELNGKIIGSPAVAGGYLIVATNRGVVYCLGK